MKKTNYLLTVVIYFITTISLFAQTNYFVSNLGDNANDGLSPAQPFSTIQFAIDQASNGDIINVATGSYLEKININKSLTLKGENEGVDGFSLSRLTESEIISNDTTVQIKANGVTIDGFKITGAIGVLSGGFTGFNIVNNFVFVAAAGILTNFVNTNASSPSISNNFVFVTQQLIPPNSDQTAAITVVNVVGANPIVLSNNNVSGSFAGYVIYNNNTTTTSTISGGLIQSVVQGISFFNVDNAANFAPTTFNVENVTINNFAGPMGAAQNGIYAFTTNGSPAGNKITLNIDGLIIDGTQNTATNSAGISLSDFTSAGSTIYIEANITNTTISNCSPRGIHAAGRVEAVVSECTFENFGATGVGYGVLAIRPTSNPANGAAHVFVEKSTFISPLVSAGVVASLGTRDGGTINAEINSFEFNGNASAIGASTTSGNGGDIVATCNWWGSTDEATIETLKSGSNITYVPFLQTNNIVQPVCTEFWTGNVDKDWNNNANWVGSIPTEGSDVVIPTGLTNYPEVEVIPAEIKDLTIESGANITVLSGNSLTVNGVLTNDGVLTLKSGATLVQTTGSTSAGAGTYNVEQFLKGSGGATPNGRFYYMGTPVSGATTSVFNAAGNNRFWTHTEVTGLYTRIMNNTTSIEAGGGYTIRMGADETVVYSSNSLNNGNYTFAGLSNTQARPKMERGIHLWSNPYPSHLDWELISKTDIDLTYQLRTQNTNTNAMVFDTYNAISGVGTNNSGNGALTNYIAPFQAIWIRVNANLDPGAIAVNNSMRSHQSGNLLKSNSDQEIIRLHLSNGSVYDEAVIYMNENASNDLDAYDSQKMMDEHHQLYSIEAGSKLVINGIENATAKESVQLGIKIEYSGNYSIEANELNTLENVVLEDKKANKFQDLKANSIYSFTTTTGEDADRFVLHFTKTIDNVTSNNGILAQEDGVRIFAVNGNQVKVIIDNKSYENANINVYNMLGALVSSQRAENRENILSLDVANGIYMVELVSKENVTTQKVLIK
jgi:hypothetical protein